MAEKAMGGVERVRAALAGHGLGCEVKELSQSTRTAQEAAAAVGCDVGQIVKSLVFKGAASGRPVLALVNGAARASEARLSELLGEPVARADPAFVREKSGFAIGGVAPVGHREPPVVLIDRTLLSYAVVWAAAGAPNAVFAVAPGELARVTGGAVADLVEP
ncbi:YbaK/EbsC family protein [Anaeromyxobacter paludicola]|uniref:Aminoacyl-tRNA deacylase n=1 Tax=Anaeromyxobacter paludicola TaxID=2918171 RepID=A0ABM7XD77_9BACT|nr:YbaK/EbsC family protein [Anaeromyxobacter paludicola]BDG09820.1 aminoacyl-tRNA deacylase [Anaeromyxobacter paludicola]